MCVRVWIYSWVCESRTTIWSPGIQVLIPVFQLLYCTLNPVNLLLFTLACSSYSLCLCLSLSHTHMLIHSPSVSLLLSPSSSPQYISLSHALNALLCSPSFLSHSPSTISFFIRIHLCRAALIETQTVSNCMRFCQTLRVSRNVEKCGQRRWQRKEWKTGWYLIIKQSPVSFLKAFSLMWRRIPYIFFISSLHLHLFHQVAGSWTAAVSDSYNFVQQQTANKESFLSVLVLVCVSRPFMNEEMCVPAFIREEGSCSCKTERPF